MLELSNQINPDIVLAHPYYGMDFGSDEQNALKQIKDNGSIIVVDNTQCIFSDDVDASPAGWVKAEYLVIDPAWYRTEEETPVYAWNDESAPKVALLNADTKLPILKEEGEWIIVSLRGATGWIHK